jgi:hypothetical protein
VLDENILKIKGIQTISKIGIKNVLEDAQVFVIISIHLNSVF